MTPELQQVEAVSAASFRRDVRVWSKRVGVEIREIRLRPMKRKVASASSSGRLTFDVGLLTEPADRRAEVVVHELVHLRVGNHGVLFRSLVRAHLAEQQLGHRRRDRTHVPPRNEVRAPSQTRGRAGATGFAKPEQVRLDSCRHRLGTSENRPTR